MGTITAAPSSYMANVKPCISSSRKMLVSRMVNMSTEHKDASWTRLASFSNISSKQSIFNVGGQRTIRSYWKNYFEQTDGLVWVVDSSDLRRLDDCKMELDNLLKEERLSGASRTDGKGMNKDDGLTPEQCRERSLNASPYQM